MDPHPDIRKAKAACFCALASLRNDRFSQTLDAFVSKASDVDAAVIEHIDRIVGLKLIDSFNIETQQREHATVLSDKVEI